MLLKLGDGCRAPARLDSLAGGAETGHKVSAVYFIGRHRGDPPTAATNRVSAQEAEPDREAGGELRLQNVEAAPIAEGTVVSEKDSPHGGSDGDDFGGKGRRTLGGDAGAAVKGSGGSELEGAEVQGVVALSAVVEPKADRLVMFRSDRVSTETLEVRGAGQEQYAVLFWMHGAKAEEAAVENQETSSRERDGGEKIPREL